jgi:class 3 adenylate cyclase/tetratricopeptide (TPR) repeat protein
MRIRSVWMVCPSCGTENQAGAKFCVECGTALAVACPSCGTPHAPGQRFCAECGASLEPGAAATPLAAVPREAPASERRLVSVLFADLVGFTTLSESRDAEEVRELLSTYFDTCRRLVSLYGGTVEKFIGDAVMAVWGTPVAQEDDAERAVRAALDLVAAIPELDPALQARAGVLTGEAAVTLGAEGEGMVAGDLVNTASRIQSAAEPATVLVGETTKRASEAAIAYEEAGLHELKGKAEAVPLYRALRVTAGRAGALKSEGLEPPFVGRDRELRLAKELFHASADEKKAHLVNVLGIAGIGKSRLSWEFEKYIDGLIGTIYWHRGRCLAYGEGVAYWALAEMVRMRAGIVEGEELDSAREKLGASLTEHVPDPEERSWIEPRLAHLLGLDERATHERDDLFAGWRLFFERLADVNPTVLVFEDMQWADVSLLDFVEHLLEWSRSHPIYVLALARPELSERHPDFGKQSRNATTLSLEPLSPQGMEALLDGFVPGLPETLRVQILERAEGVPLYAVETVRMLLDRGLLERKGDVYRPTGEIAQLDVPETLHALVAARLDGLSQDERRVVQDGSVLGKTFTKGSLSSVSGVPEAEIEPLLTSLVRKEVLSLQADPLSPERGQYGFLQDLVKRVAYETLSKRERKARHLAAADYLERSWGPAEHEIVEIVASHYLSAYEAAPDADDAAGIKAKASEHLTRAGERAVSLAANEEAQRYFGQAADLADDSLLRAGLYERAGRAAYEAGRLDEAHGQLARALELFREQGESHPAARVSARLSEVEFQQGQHEQALQRAEQAYAVLSAEEPDADVAALSAELARLYVFNADLERAAERIETALDLAERLWLPEVLANALSTKGIIAEAKGHMEEALALQGHALKFALDNDLLLVAMRAYVNGAEILLARDRHEEPIAQLHHAVELASRAGSRRNESWLLGILSYCQYHGGNWNEALESAARAFEPAGTHSALVPPLIAIERGDVAGARRLLELDPRFENPSDAQDRAWYGMCGAALLRAEGRHEESLAAAEDTLAGASALGYYAAEASVQVLESAFAVGELERIEAVLADIDSLRPGELRPWLRAQAARFRARLAAARGETDGVEQGFKTAEQIFREYGIPVWLAVTELEHGEWLVTQSRGDEAESLLTEAREIFERLEAKPWLERASRAGEPVAATP